MAIEIIRVPDLGGAETVDVIELSLAQGDNIAAEDSLVVLESDKATMDVPSPIAGQLVKYLVAEGDTVKVGDPIVELEVASPESASDPQLEESVQVEEIQSKAETSVIESSPEPVAIEPVAALTVAEPSGGGESGLSLIHI